VLLLSAAAMRAVRAIVVLALGLFLASSEAEGGALRESMLSAAAGAAGAAELQSVMYDNTLAAMVVSSNSYSNSYSGAGAADSNEVARLSKWCGNNCNGGKEVTLTTSLLEITTAAAAAAAGKTNAGGSGISQLGEVCWSRRAAAGDSFFLRASASGTSGVLTATFFLANPCAASGGASYDKCETRPWMQVTLSRASVSSSRLDSSGVLSVCLRAPEVAVRIKLMRDGIISKVPEDFAFSFESNKAGALNQLII
jgi:hypothetical protein